MTGSLNCISRIPNLAITFSVSVASAFWKIWRVWRQCLLTEIGQGTPHRIGKKTDEACCSGGSSGGTAKMRDASSKAEKQSFMHCRAWFLSTWTNREV